MTSFASPWFFGPYGQQLRILAEELLKKDYEVYYLILDTELSVGIHDYNKIRDLDTSKNNVIIDEDIWHNVKFLGGIKQINYASTNYILSNNFNEIFDTYKINCMIMCMDINKLVFDNPFSFKSIIWYPNHFTPIENTNKLKLGQFHYIASLCPTDQKLLQTTFPEKRIEYIPHIIELDRVKKDRSTIRKMYNISDDKFVILINSGNYDFQNRKSLDTSIFACEQFMKNKENVVLFIHTYNLKILDDTNNHLSIDGMLRLEELLGYTSIPNEQIIIHEKLVPYDDILDIMEMSDVLLQGSKSEGFGMPIIESQLLGVPVITTKFGAMCDNTFYGISVPYYQKCYDNLSAGIWVTPDINGMSEALEKVYIGDIKDTSEYAIKKIGEIMSREYIVNKFIGLIEEEFTPLVIPNKNILTIINYDECLNKFRINHNIIDKLDYDMIKSEWVIINNGLIIEEESLANLLSTVSHEELIFLKTNYGEMVYPTVEDIQNQNIIIDKMIFCIKTKYLKFMDKDMDQKYINYILFKTFASKLKTSLYETVLCTNK